MKRVHPVVSWIGALGWLLGCLASARADIDVLLSVKFILNNDAGSSRPGGPIGSAAGFVGEINHGNNVLAATGRGYSLYVAEYLDIQPPVPTGASATVTGSTTLNDRKVLCTNTAGLQQYMMVQGNGVPANSIILSIDPNVSFEISSSATATNASVSITGSYPSNYWFDIPARLSRAIIEAAALADQTTWRWNPNAINIYVNSSSSGQCSFVAGGLSISLGDEVSTGTVLHEIGHFHDLKHTHDLDYEDNTNPPMGNFTLADLRNGDGLSETAPDNPNISTRDQLSRALNDGRTYNDPMTTDAERAFVDSAFENLMSYHNENVILPGQADIWTKNANVDRGAFNTGYTWFVANVGSDSASGLSAAQPFATLVRGLNAVLEAPDIVLLRSGTYLAPANGLITTPCTLRATEGVVTILPP